jgi:hypothetical protein
MTRLSAADFISMDFEVDVFRSVKHFSKIKQNSEIK